MNMTVLAVGSQSSVWNDQKIYILTTETSRWLMGKQELHDKRRMTRNK